MDCRTELARQTLTDGGYTCVFCGGDECEVSRKRGVAPLLELLGKERTLTEFCAADKVVGRAAAFLYVLLDVHELYAEVISESALDVLEGYKIPCFYGQRVERIINRTGDGFCPMETAVMDIFDPQAALLKIKETLEKLNR